MRENRDFVVPAYILTPFAHAPFSWAARHTTVCLDLTIKFEVNWISIPKIINNFTRLSESNFCHAHRS